MISNEELNQFNEFAEVLGPSGPVILRSIITELLSARATIADLEAKLRELRQLNDEFYLLLVDNPDTKLMADKIMVNIFGKCKPSDTEVSAT